MIVINEIEYPSVKNAFRSFSWRGGRSKGFKSPAVDWVDTHRFAYADLSKIRVKPGPQYMSLNFENTDFSGSFFSDVTFHQCYFRRATLEGTKFYKCRFVGCYFNDLDLSNTTFKESGFDYPEWKDHAEFFSGSILPDYIQPFKGQDTIVYKKVETRNGRQAVAKLLLPGDVRRVRTLGMSKKMRAERVLVLDIRAANWRNPERVDEAVSLHESRFRYRIGEWAEPLNGFSDNFLKECAAGIHFFASYSRAKAYHF